jgi:RHS repeat-associated protein
MRGMAQSIAAAAAAMAGLLALCGAATAASAQDAPPISPLRVESDHNGVNIIDGKIMMPSPVLSVPAVPRLRYDRAANATPLARGHTYPDHHGTWLIHTGTGKSEMFDCDADNGAQICTSEVGTGSFFRPGTHAYKPAGTGEVWSFNLQVTHSYSINGTVEAYVASSVAYADGERINYTYEGGYLDGTTAITFRTTRLDDNLGYYIQLTYQPGEPGSVEWSTVATAALYATSNPTTPLQQLTYSGDTITQVGSDGASRTSACTGCRLSGSSELEVTSGTTTLPGEAEPALQVGRGTNDLVSTVVRDGVAWTYAYTNVRVGRTGTYVYDKVTVDGPNGYHQVYDISVYEGSRNVIAAITDSLGRRTTVDFDPAYQPVRIVLPELNEVSVLYDEKGNIYRKTTKAKPGSGLPDRVETASYPLATCAAVGCFRPDWARDALGRQTDYAWNGAGQLVEQTDPADAQGVRRKTLIDYEAAPSGFSRRKVVRVCGDPSTAGGGANPCGTANEIRTEYDYSGSTALPSAERRIDAAAGVTLTTTYAYDDSGRPLAVDGPLAGTDDASYFRYDGWGRKIWEIGPKGANGLRNAKHFTYRDSDDAVIAVEEGTVPDQDSTALAVLTRTDTRYDARRNPVRETVSAGGTTYGLIERSFDDRGQLVCQAQRMNAAVFADATDACTLGAEGSAGPDRITHNVYDAAGQLLQVQRAYATPLQQNYATYEYTPNGRQKAVTDANGNRAEMTFDGLDRQRRWIFPSNTPGVANQGDYEEYGYDAAGNRTSLRKRDGVTLTYLYDDLDRLRMKTVPASATGAAGYSVYYGYDVRGLQAWTRFGSDAGPGIANSWDGFGRLSSTTTTIDGSARTLSFGYDAHGNKASLSGNWGYGPGWTFDAADRLKTVSDGIGVAVQAGYDTAGRLQSLASGPAGGAGTVAYGYDAVGRLQSLTHDLSGTGSDQALTFGYNPASQMVMRTSSNDAYASNTAQSVSRAYSVNGLNQYTAAGPVTLAYDANGNLTSDGRDSYVYDSENRLVSVSGGHTATLSYDPLGRLWQVAAPSGTTRFLYDGDKLVSEFDGAGTPLRSYVHGPGADEPLIAYEAATGWARRYLHADHQGSIVAIADDAGNPIAINAYDPWGIPNEANYGRFGYTGQAWLGELGLWYYKARIYSPTLGRFLQTDPVGYKDDLDLYAYVGNDPITGRDPTGLAAANTCSRLGDTSCSGSYGDSLAGAVQIARAPPPRAVGQGDGSSTISAPAPGIYYASVGGSLPAIARPSRDPVLVAAAERAASSVPPFFNSILGRTVFGWLRGIIIHREFAAQIRGMDNTFYNAEVSYYRGRVVDYGYPGSVRADAVVGPTGHPLFAVDLKTGGAFITNDERRNYYAHLPAGTLLQEIIVP